jgi:hypothetical protein
MRRTVFVLALVTTIFLNVVGAAFCGDEQAPPIMHERPSVAMMLFDAIIARPILVSGAIVTTAFCLVTGPATLMTGTSRQSEQILVVAPWRFAAARKLGDWSGSTVDNEPIAVIDPNERP